LTSREKKKKQREFFNLFWKENLPIG
jgi:hypothetical protein